jgi:hypothetical protein
MSTELRYRKSAGRSLDCNNGGAASPTELLLLTMLCGNARAGVRSLFRNCLDARARISCSSFKENTNRRSRWRHVVTAILHAQHNACLVYQSRRAHWCATRRLASTCAVLSSLLLAIITGQPSLQLRDSLQLQLHNAAFVVTGYPQRNADIARIMFVVVPFVVVVDDDDDCCTKPNTNNSFMLTSSIHETQ